MNRLALSRSLIVASVLLLFFVTLTAAAGEKVVVYGADATPEQRQELAQIFGVDPSAQAGTVTTPEMVAALDGTGLSVAPTDKSISSSALTCLDRGAGLTVQTQNITRITAAIYANALVTAGAGDAHVLIAAPPSDPVTGETALVGVMKAFPQCPNAVKLDPMRTKAAYEQIAWTVALARESGDLNKASNVMLKTMQSVILGQAKDDTAIGQSIDNAATSEGLAIPAYLRPDLITFLKDIGKLDFGGYAKGYQIQQLGPNQVKVAPVGVPAAAASPAAATAAAATATAQAAVPAASAPAAEVFTGTVKHAGNPLTVATGGRDRQVALAPALTVTRNGKSAALADIRSGDRVTVTTDAQGVATHLDARHSSSNLGWLAWAIPLLVLLALLAAALWRLESRRRRSFILEPKRPLAHK